MIPLSNIGINLDGEVFPNSLYEIKFAENPIRLMGFPYPK